MIEYALAQLLQHWGIRPQQLIGYSLGEYVAACLAGVFSLEDAVQVVARRAALIEEVGPGAMLAVSLSEAELQPLLSDELSLAIINGEKMCVVGGTVAAIAELERRLTGQEIASRRLPTEHAFHTPMMAAVSARFADVLAAVKLNAPQIPMLSNVTGQLLTEAEARDPQYWIRHMCETVRFCGRYRTNPDRRNRRGRGSRLWAELEFVCEAAREVRGESGASSRQYAAA